MHKELQSLVDVVKVQTHQLRSLQNEMDEFKKDIKGMGRIRNKAQQDLRKWVDHRLDALDVSRQYRYRLYADLRHELGVSSYKDITEKDFIYARQFINNWVPQHR